MKEFITKTKNGYERDDGSARYMYDKQGNYIGQYQPDMLSDDLGVGELWFPTYSGDVCFHILTQKQMKEADILYP